MEWLLTPALFAQNSHLVHHLYPRVACGTAELVGATYASLPAGDPDLLARRLCDVLDDPDAREHAVLLAADLRRRTSIAGLLEQFTAAYEAALASSRA